MSVFENLSNIRSQHRLSADMDQDGSPWSGLVRDARSVKVRVLFRPGAVQGSITSNGGIVVAAVGKVQEAFEGQTRQYPAYFPAYIFRHSPHLIMVRWETLRSSAAILRLNFIN